MVNVFPILMNLTFCKYANPTNYNFDLVFMKKALFINTVLYKYSRIQKVSLVLYVLINVSSGAIVYRFE